MAKQEQKILIAMYHITIKHGLSGSITKSVAPNTTVGDVIHDQAVKAVLGYGENITVLCDGEALSLTEAVSDGDTLYVEKQAAAKA